MFHSLRTFRIGILILSFTILLLPSLVSAASANATVSVEVKNGSKMYVVMYKVSVVNDEWWGRKFKVKKIPAGKESVNFAVKPGQVVDFKVFETYEDVNTNKKRQFYSPPLKNFPDNADSGKLCHVAGVDFSAKLSETDCINELTLDYSGSDAKVFVKINNGVVGMYNVAIVNNEWWGELVGVKSIPVGKEQAVFSVTPGQIVDFLAFKNKAEALKVKKYQFTVPPYENFSGTYDDEGMMQDGFCTIAGVDISKKLENEIGETFCGNEIELMLQE